MRVIGIVQNSFAKYQDIPVGSMVLQLNDWIVGDTQEEALTQLNRNYNLNYYFITPESDIKHIHKEKGKMGFSLGSALIEKSQMETLRSMLEEWKNENE